jgi:hypothetical protein
MAVETKTVDIKKDLIESLVALRGKMEAGNEAEAGYILSEVLDAVSSSSVSVLCERVVRDERKPGELPEGETNYAAYNID